VLGRLAGSGALYVHVTEGAWGQIKSAGCVCTPAPYALAQRERERILHPHASQPVWMSLIKHNRMDATDAHIKHRTP
jgi:hypothetical protein